MPEPRRLLEAFLTPPKTRELSREQDLLARAHTTSFRPNETGFARGGGDEVQVYSWGQGPAILLVHGWGSRASHFEALIAALEAGGRQVIAFDAPAHGRSGGTFSGAPAFAAALRVIAAQSGPFEAVVAHSLGTVATSLVLGKEVNAQRAVMLGSCCWVEPLAVKFVRDLGASDEEIQEMLELARAEFRPEEVSAELSVPSFGGIPVLMMHDPADAEMPFAHSAALAAAWPGAVLEPVLGVGHRRILRARDVVHRAVQFLQI